MNTTKRHLAPHPRRGGHELNVLVVALDAATPVEMRDAEVLVVAPALNSRLRHWLSDEDAARRRAGRLAAALVQRMDAHGVRAEGRVGDPDPLLAIADALTTFPADEIVIAAESGPSTRLADDLVVRARDRFSIPVVRAGEWLATAA